MFVNKYVIRNYAVNTLIHVFLLTVTLSCLFPIFWMIRAYFLAASREPADAILARELDLTPGEEMVVLRRMVEADSRPIAIMENRLVARFFPRLDEDDRWVPSLYQFLQARYGLTIVSALESTV